MDALEYMTNKGCVGYKLSNLQYRNEVDCDNRYKFEPLYTEDRQLIMTEREESKRRNCIERQAADRKRRLLLQVYSNTDWPDWLCS